MFKKINMDNSLFTWLLMATILLHHSIGQRTYMRSCNCEPTLDGKCAYTLMIPLATNDAGNKQTCPTESSKDNNMTSSKSKSEQLEKQLSVIEKEIKMLSSNVSSVMTWSGDQAKIISQLQSKVMELADILKASDSKTMQTNCTICIDVQKRVENQTVQINQIIKHLGNISNETRTLETLKATLNSNLADIQNMTSQLTALEQQLAAVGIDVTNAYTELNSLKNSYYLCSNKGLLVSGDKMYVDDSGINSSSSSLGGIAARGRINSTSINSKPGAWCAGYQSSSKIETTTTSLDEPNNDYEWLQFDLGSPKVIYGLVTRGRSDYDQWVTSYKIQTTDEWAADDGWTTYKDVVGYEMIFTGNSDKDTPVSHMLWQPLKTRYIRFVPVAANKNKCMRADVIGCLDNDL